MSLYKILLVDDEEEIRRSIVRRIKWEVMGFSIAGEAENGIEALDVIEKTSPDVVITDIKMPFMDGIKLAENIHYRYPTTKVIILSGFDDFEYAQEAMKLGVMRYILKPINAVEMNELLVELKNLLDEEIASKNNIELLKLNYEKSIPFLKERFLNYWIEDYVSESIIKENLGLLGLPFIQEGLRIVVIRPDDLIIKEENEQTLKNKSLLKVAIYTICEEIVEKYKLGILFMRMNEMILMIPLEKEQTDTHYVFSRLEEIRITVKKYLNTTVTIGVGTACTDQTLLYKSYLAAKTALDYTITLGKDKVIYIGDIEPEQSNQVIFEEIDERELVTAIKTGGQKEIEEIIEKLLDKLEGSQLTLNDYQVYMLEVFSCLMRVVKSMGVEQKKVFPGEGNFLAYISHLKTREEIKIWFLEVSVAIAKEIRFKRNSSKNDLIEKAKIYIENHYGDDTLSAETLCQHLHISTTYFSALFKKETKLTFTAYLTQVRIEKAKELLVHTQMKAFDIGKQVGYTEGHYFSYVFKKITGIAPTEYRNGKI